MTVLFIFFVLRKGKEKKLILLFSLFIATGCGGRGEGWVSDMSSLPEAGTFNMRRRTA